MTCSCAKKGIVCVCEPLCAEHFFLDIESRVLNTIKTHRLITRKDNVLVAVSGGKDSMVLIHILAKHFKDQIFALIIDEGIMGYRDCSIEGFLKLAPELGIPYEIVHARDQMGVTSDELAKHISGSNCQACGVVRRYVLNTYARTHGFSKVATGHNRDDEAQSALMNLVMGDVSRQARAGYTTGRVAHKHFVERIKPLRDVSERETARFVMQKKWPVHPCACPYSVGAFRKFVQQALDTYESHESRAKQNLLESFDTLSARLKTFPSAQKPLHECTTCGEPTSDVVCKACKILLKIAKRTK